MKKIIKLAVFLAVTCALAGLALSYVNSITKPLIDKQEMVKVEEALKEVFPEASSFDKLEITNKAKEIKDVYQAIDLGYVYNLEIMGYKDIIKLTVGINKDGTVKKVIVTSINDTPGVGDKVSKEPFISSLNGKTASDKIDTISGATISSSAVIKAVNIALNDFTANYGGAK